MLFFKKNGAGVTVFAVIAESHISVHTYPEERYAAVDIFTCGAKDPLKGYKYLRAKLKAMNENVIILQRGVRFKDE